MKKLILMLMLALSAAMTLAQDDNASQDTVISVGETDQGVHLVSSDGHPLYLFTVDSQGEPGRCVERCMEDWPAVILHGELLAGEGVDQELLGTMEREDGSLQVTYNGWPLYYYTPDLQLSGEDVTSALGQAVGDEWFLVTPEGNALGQ